MNFTFTNYNLYFLDLLKKYNQFHLNYPIHRDTTSNKKKKLSASNLEYCHKIFCNEIIFFYIYNKRAYSEFFLSLYLIICMNSFKY